MSTFEADSAIRIFDSTEDRLPRAPLIAAVGSLAAAAIHAWVVRSHAAHWWGYAAFFAGLAVAQAVYGGIIFRRPTRRLALVGIGANLAVLGVYAWSRLVAVPMGPHAGTSEAVGLPDLLAAGAEAGLVIALVVVARGAALPRRTAGNRSALTAVLIGLVAAGFAGPAGHAHPKPSEILLSEGPETWVGPLPTPSVPKEEEPVVEPSVDPQPAEEKPPRCAPEAADGISAPASAGPGAARAVVTTVHSETGPQLWMYVPSTNENRKLLTNAETCWMNHPSWRDPSYVSFHGDGGIYGFDLEKGTVELLVATNAMVSEWSPDGKSLAYLGYTNDGQEKLVKFDPADGSKEVIRSFGAGEGRCGSESDETSISWAPDGHALIVVITHLTYGSDTMFVIDENGKDLVDPRKGTHAAWAPDSTRVYYREFEGDGKWFALNSGTGDRGTLGAMKPGTHGLVVSPDGSMLAYADGEDDVGTFIYDVATKKQRRVAENAVEPMWIGPRTLLVTDTKSCGDECFHSAWLAAGTASKVDVGTEDRKRVALDSTMDADAWLDELAVVEPDPDPAPTTPAPSPEPTATDEPLPLPTPTESTEPSPTPSASPTA